MVRVLHSLLLSMSASSVTTLAVEPQRNFRPNGESREPEADDSERVGRLHHLHRGVFDVSGGVWCTTSPARITGEGVITKRREEVANFPARAYIPPLYPLFSLLPIEKR